MAPRTMKTNPAFLTEQELVDSFVVRHADLELIMRVIRENATKSNQHVLLVGPRGIGKTTLALRAVAEIKRTPELNAYWYPIVFAEESYQVSTPGEFWLEAIFHLARQTDLDEWRSVFDELSGESDDEHLRERALAQLMDFADSVGKRLLIVVENLNMLLRDQLTDEDAWTLRHTLMNEPRLMLLASATQRFEEVEHCGKALFEQFRTYVLRPLDTPECAALWKSLTQEEVSEFRIRPIEILTGGNPRLIRIIAQFGARKSLRQLMTDLTRLVDEHTEYFKSYLDGLAAVERKVFVSLAEIWSPAEAREVAKVSRLEVSKTSALLNRLVERGAVAVVNLRGRKKSYQVAERMYNIYYLMRRRGGPSSRVRAAVNFIVGLYAPEELAGIAEDLTRVTCEPAAFAWAFYTIGELELMARAEDWATQAVGIDPENAEFRHLLACVLCALGRPIEAEAHARKYLAAVEWVKSNPEFTIELVAGFAAAGHGRQALEILKTSPSAPHLEPLIVALELFLGDEVRAPVEIEEVAKDIVKRIEQRRERVAKSRVRDSHT